MTRIKCVIALMVVVAFGGVVGLVYNEVEDAQAVTADELEYFAQNDAPFYEPCDGASGGSSSGGICGTNQNYAGEQVWTDKQMEALKANQPFYEKAAQPYGIPWQLIAVVHVREHGLARSNPSNGQGVYQFYSASERAKCQGGVFTPGNISDEQFQIQTNCAARRLKEDYGAGLDLTKDDDIKMLFFKYNGTAGVYKKQALALGFSQEEANRGEGSPYVMNRYDAKREPSSTWGQIKRDGGSIEYPANRDFGAFVYYKAITCDGSDSDNLTSEEGDGNDAATEVDEVGLNVENKIDSIAKDGLKTDAVLTAKTKTKKKKDTTGGGSGTSWTTAPEDSDDGYNEDLTGDEDGDEDDDDDEGGDDGGEGEDEGDDSEYTGGGAGSGINCGGSDANNDGANTNNINETAFKLAWPLGTKEEKYAVKKGGEPTAAYKKAVKELGLKGHGFTHTPDCGCFVTTVVRYSGVDKKFKKCGAGIPNKTYAEKHSKKWEVIEWNGDRSKVQAGDVITAWRTPGRSQHSFIILEKDGKMYRADAHYVAKEWGRVTRLKKKYTTFPHRYIIRAKNSVATNGTPKAGGTVVKDNQGNSDIGASAIALAWPEGTPESTYKAKATDKFANYFNTLDQAKADAGQCYAGGKSCDRFVATVVRYAGADPDMSFGPVPSSYTYVKDHGDIWEKVQTDKPKSAESYESGDVLFFWEKGAENPGHVAIYAKDADGKGHVVQASNCRYFGVVKDTSNITSTYFPKVEGYRNKNNNSNAVAQCDSCATAANSEEGAAGELKAGGMTLEEAKAFMKPYHDAAMGKYYHKNYGDIKFQGAAIHDDGCPFGPMNNCVSFSQWFINKYTTKGPDWGHTADGVGMVKRLASDLGLETGSEPRPYAVFSKAGPSVHGHTGVILGVDKDRKKVVVGEASCSSGQSKLYYEPRAFEYSFSEIGSWTYAYTDNVLKGAVKSD